MFVEMADDDTYYSIRYETLNFKHNMGIIIAPLLEQSAYIVVVFKARFAYQSHTKWLRARGCITCPQQKGCSCPPNSRRKGETFMITTLYHEKIHVMKFNNIFVYFSCEELKKSTTFDAKKQRQIKARFISCHAASEEDHSWYGRAIIMPFWDAKKTCIGTNSILCGSFVIR